MGANPALSWIGVLGYAGGSSLPALVRLYLYNIYTLCSLCSSITVHISFSLSDVSYVPDYWVDRAPSEKD